jgi:F420-non-reducing hydrogenase iron-sulfur subunit
MSYVPNVKGFFCTQRQMEGNNVPGLKVEKIPCARMFDPTVYLDAFLDKADGVLVVGCRTTDCRNTASKVHNVRKIEVLKELLEGTDLSGRFQVIWLLSAEVGHIPEEAEDFVTALRERGPVHFSPRLEIELSAMKEMLENRRIRNFVAKYHQLVERNNVFGENLLQAHVDAGLRDAVKSEFARAMIHCAARKRPVSVEEAAEMFNLPKSEVLRSVTAMLKRNALEIASVEDNVPRYRAIGQEAGQ